MDLNRESSVFKKDIVAIDELKRDRDIRIKEIRSDFDILQSKFDFLQKDHAELEVRHEALTNIHSKQTDDYEQLARNM